MKNSPLKLAGHKPVRSRHRQHAFRAVILAVAGTAALLGSARAEVIVSDDFESGGGSDLSSIESKATWEVSGKRKALSVVTDPEGLNHGNALSMGNVLVFARLPDTKLEVGQSLVLSMRFRSNDQDVTYLAPLRIGLCESKDDAPDKGETAGYWFSTGPGARRRAGSRSSRTWTRSSAAAMTASASGIISSSAMTG